MSHWQKKKLIERDGAKCDYCGEPGKIFTLTVDHVIPRSKGGSNRLTNLVLACKKCNLNKMDLSREEFLQSEAFQRIMAKKQK